MCGLASPGAAVTIGGMSHANLSPTPSRRLRRTAPRRLQRGFSLLEALVSIVILSFGLLGVAGLQASSLKYSRDARNQSVAVNLARELAEMIRSNARVSGKKTEAENPYLKSARNLFDPNDPDPAPPTNCLTPGEEACSTEDEGVELANAQVADWLHRVNKALPGARIAVCLDTAPYDADGLPQWDCTAPTATSSDNIIAIKMGWERDDYAGKPQTAENAPPFVILPVTPTGQE